MIDRWLAQATAPPLVIGVVGGTSCGKTTLVNAWTADDAPVGVAGVTRQVRRVAAGARVFVDTPSLDEAVDLHAETATWDAVVWLVDALRPAAERERARVEAMRRLVGPLFTWVSRLDLVDRAERGEVLARVGRFGSAPLAVDPRCPPAPPTIDPLVAHRRRTVLVGRLRERLATLDAAIAIRDRWRDAVRGAALPHDVDRIRAELERALSDHPLGAGRPTPRMPMLPAGQRGTALRASWLADGDAVLADWLPEAWPTPEHLAERDRIRTLLHDLRGGTV